MSGHEDANIQEYHEILSDAKELLLLLLSLPGPVNPVELIWGAIEALVVDAAGRTSDHALRRPGDSTEPGPAEIDSRSHTAMAALRQTIADALEAARILAATDRHDPLWNQRYEELGQLLTAITTNSDNLTQAAVGPANMSPHSLFRQRVQIKLETREEQQDLRGPAQKAAEAALRHEPPDDLRKPQRGIGELSQGTSDALQPGPGALEPSARSPYVAGDNIFRAPEPDTDPWWRLVVDPPDDIGSATQIPDPDLRLAELQADWDQVRVDPPPRPDPPQMPASGL
jgi:hypothetical protein